MVDSFTNVLHLIGDAGPSGINSFVLTMLRSADRSRFSPGVCCFGGEGAMLDAMRETGAPVFSIPATGRFRVRDVLAYHHLVRSGRYRVVHAHVGARVPRLTARLAGARTVSHVHGPPEASGTRSTAGNRGKALNVAIGTGSDAIVACSKSLASFLSHACPALAGRMSVIENGVDLRRWTALDEQGRILRKTALGLRGDSVVVGFAGRMVPLKRIDMLIEAAESLLPSHPKLEFVLLGDGELRPALERRAARLGPRIRFPGATVSSDWIPCFDVLALPSESEGMPMAVLEAMACGNPVVASDVGGIAEAIVDNESGVLIEPGEAQSLARAIGRLAADPALRNRLGRAARARAESLFDSVSMARKFERLYDTLLARK